MSEYLHLPNMLPCGKQIVNDPSHFVFPRLFPCVVTKKCPRQLDSHVLVKVKSMNIRWAWIICWILVSVFNSELSGECSVYQQVDAYVDQLGEDAHLANFYIPGPQFVFVNWLFSPRAYFAHLNFVHAACLQETTAKLWNIMPQEHLPTYTECFRVFCLYSTCCKCVSQPKKGDGMSTGREICSKTYSRLGVGRATVTFL